MVVFLAKLFKNRTIDRCGFLVFGLVAAWFAVLAKKDEVTRTMYKKHKVFNFMSRQARV